MPRILPTYAYAQESHGRFHKRRTHICRCSGWPLSAIRRTQARQKLATIIFKEIDDRSQSKFHCRVRQQNAPCSSDNRKASLSIDLAPSVAVGHVQVDSMFGNRYWSSFSPWLFPDTRYSMSSFIIIPTTGAFLNWFPFVPTTPGSP